MNEPQIHLAALAATAVLVGGIFLVTGLLAARKGYNFFPWVFACGLLGLIVLTFLPMANDPQISSIEQRERAEKGNRIGQRLAIVMVVLALFRALASTS